MNTLHTKERLEEIKTKIRKKYNGAIMINAGGTGTRLWPLSRKARPKQFSKALGNKTLFRDTIERILPLFDIDRIFVATNEQHKNFVLEDFPEMKEGNLILEPESRDHLAAITLSLSYIQKKIGDATVFISWSDDHFESPDVIRNVMYASIAIANQRDKLVRIGCRPMYPTDKYGYIQLGDLIDKKSGTELFTVKSFKEKPDIETAKKYVKSWDYLWNIGNFTTNTKKFLSLVKEFEPEVLSDVEEITSNVGTQRYEEVLHKIYPTIKKETFEVAITEKMNKEDLLVIPADLDWDDIGSWDSVYNQSFKTDEEENVLEGDAHFVSIESSGNFVRQENAKKLVAMYGVKDLVVVDMEDAMLIIPRKLAPNAKKIVEELKKRKGDAWT